MFAPVIGAAYTMTTKREAHWSEQTKAQNTEKGMYVSLKQLRGDGERYGTPARAAAKETSGDSVWCSSLLLFDVPWAPCLPGIRYRIYSNKRCGAYLIFRATSAALI